MSRQQMSIVSVIYTRTRESWTFLATHDQILYLRAMLRLAELQDFAVVDDSKFRATIDELVNLIYAESMWLCINSESTPNIDVSTELALYDTLLPIQQKAIQAAKLGVIAAEQQHLGRQLLTIKKELRSIKNLQQVYKTNLRADKLWRLDLASNNLNDLQQLSLHRRRHTQIKLAAENCCIKDYVIGVGGAPAYLGSVTPASDYDFDIYLDSTFISLHDVKVILEVYHNSAADVVYCCLRVLRLATSSFTAELVKKEYLGQARRLFTKIQPQRIESQYPEYFGTLPLMYTSSLPASQAPGILKGDTLDLEHVHDAFIGALTGNPVHKPQKTSNTEI